MIQVLLVIHLIVTVLMIGLILLQRSEGGGLGVGGGSGGLGAFASPRATANALSRATMGCFAAFVALSLILAVLAGGKASSGSASLIDQLSDAPAEVTAPAAEPATETPAEPVKPSVPMGD